ncbi:3',5'-cyclic-AMP phosphodiesterase [Psychromonas aquimarina]|uniref:3',5'-cyclic-AMP phosphodiesterase n=1 Tax=Psychromonas aquimarina TaxID=444919 RepID=UPI000429CCD9|nr:3',5'-cyclic-AMP phosphodiesterase [Psychromonas aquimarina]
MKTKVAQLKANKQGCLELLQITDTHLFADRDKDLLGIKTVQSYEAVVEHARQYSTDCQAVLSTGDLSQDHSAQSYLDFTTEIKKLDMPCYWLPGNHDIQTVMLPSLLKQGLARTTQISSEFWQIILLDSQVEGVPHGFLSDAQLCFLEEALAEHPYKHTLICIHHHILPVGSAWLDQHILKNNEQFLALIKPFKNIRAVLSGHVHQAGDVTQDGVRFLTTPSTCVQFKPNSDDFALDSRAPGYRYLGLHRNGEIETKVERIEQGAFTVDEDAKGY